MRAWGRGLAVVVAVAAAGSVAEAAAETVTAAESGSVPVTEAVSESGSVPGSVTESGSGSAAEAVPATVPVDALVLVTPVQGSEALRVEYGERVTSAVRRGLEGRGYSVGVSQEALGQAVVACQTPECVEQALDAAGVAFAVVPALWSREAGGEELTLTLVQRSGRSVNASGLVDDDHGAVAALLVDELLGRRDAAAASAAASGTGAASGAGDTVARRRPHAWKAGPVVLIAGGAAAFIAIGVAAGVRTDSQQLNTGAVAAWSVVGAAAIAGGIAWFVVGDKRRRRRTSQANALPELALYPTGFDLRLRF